MGGLIPYSVRNFILRTLLVRILFVEVCAVADDRRRRLARSILHRVEVVTVQSLGFSVEGSWSGRLGGSGLTVRCRNPIKKPWVLIIWVLCIQTYYLGVRGPGFLNQVPTVGCVV